MRVLPRLPLTTCPILFKMCGKGILYRFHQTQLHESLRRSYRGKISPSSAGRLKNVVNLVTLHRILSCRVSIWLFFGIRFSYPIHYLHYVFHSCKLVSWVLVSHCVSTDRTRNACICMSHSYLLLSNHLRWCLNPEPSLLICNPCLQCNQYNHLAFAFTQSIHIDTAFAFSKLLICVIHVTALIL